MARRERHRNLKQTRFNVGIVAGCLKQARFGPGTVAGCLLLMLAVLLLCGLSISLVHRVLEDTTPQQAEIDVEELWKMRDSHGWRPSSIPADEWKSPPNEKNGFLLVHCNGGINRQRRSISNAVLIARILNATLVLPGLDETKYWYENSGFSDIYDVDHFIKTLENDVEIVRTLPRTRWVDNKKKPFRPFQLRPPWNASLNWYGTVALQKIIEHGAVHLTPFPSQLLAGIDKRELQKLRCRVNFHSLRFKEDVRQLSYQIVKRLRSEGRFMAVHLRFEMDMFAFSRCLSVFSEDQQEILRKYQTDKSDEKIMVKKVQNLSGKCPFSPREVGVILHSMGFDNSTRIYVATKNIFRGEQFLQPLRALFPRLETRYSIATSEELAVIDADDKDLLGSAVDYMVCLLADIFISNYDGASYFTNNLIGQRLYYGFRTSIQPNRKALASIFTECDDGMCRNFENQIRLAMKDSRFGDLHARVPPESLYINPWPDCFCKSSSETPEYRCSPRKRWLEVGDVEDNPDEETRELSNANQSINRIV